MNICVYLTDLGKIGIAETDGSITHLFLENDIIPPNATKCETPLLIEASKQLNQYLAGHLKKFTLPLFPMGTPFRQQVWKQLCEIPYGHTATYKEIAIKIGNEKAARAVGLANNRNPIPIFIPCHRVIGANGALTGYRGGIAIKQRLLAMEGK